MWVRNSEKPSHTTMFSFVCAFCYAYKQLLHCLRADSLKVCWVWTLVTLIDKTRLDCQPCFEGFKPKQPDRPKLPVTRTVVAVPTAVRITGTTTKPQRHPILHTERRIIPIEKQVIQSYTNTAAQVTTLSESYQ